MPEIKQIIRIRINKIYKKLTNVITRISSKENFSIIDTLHIFSQLKFNPISVTTFQCIMSLNQVIYIIIPNTKIELTFVLKFQVLLSLSTEAALKEKMLLKI